MNRTRDTNERNQPANKNEAEGERWRSEPDTVARREQGRTGDVSGSDEGGGITNRPIGDEVANQALVPERGESRKGAHAGHGDRNRSVEEE